MKTKIIITIVLLTLLAGRGFSQFSITKGNSGLDIDGYIITEYEKEFYPSGTTDMHNNKFTLGYAVLKFKGVSNRDLRYETEIDFSGLAANPDNATMSIGDDFVKQFWVEYRGLKNVCDIKFGLNKVPFSHSSLTGEHNMIFLQRAYMIRNAFNRRDIGVTLHRSLWYKKINIYAGAYTGMGGLSLGGDNDASGNLEYVGRIEFSYPEKYKDKSEADLVHLPTPVFTMGANARYTEKSINTGKDLITMVDGKKTGIGGDINLKWEGLNINLEFDQFKIQPHATSPVNLENKQTDYYRTGGVVCMANYYFACIRSAFGVRYDEYNLNDLAIGDRQKDVCYAYNFFFNGWKSVFKIQYYQILKDPNTQALWTNNQIRIGYQFMF